MDEKINTAQPGQVYSIDEAMALAMHQARKGAPYVSPNPVVGCVVLDKSHRLLATGYHEKYGSAHAEINALQNLTTEQIQSAKFIVTLEPCAHEGKTPSCAKTLAKYPIGEVIFGLIDPNPLVAGQGADILKQAGIKTSEYNGRYKKDLYELAEIFLKNFQDKKIFVAAKIASSLDGHIALKSGESKWITSAESREFVHELRSHYDAVLVGRTTIEKDNPKLNVRHPTIVKENKLVIMDPSAKLIQRICDGEEFEFLKVRNIKNVFIAVSQSHFQKKYARNDLQIIFFSSLENLLSQLWDQGLRSVFIEGGAKTYSSFLKENLIDRIHLFIAPIILGGDGGLSWTVDFSVEKMIDRPQIKNLQTRHIGPDLYLTGRIK